MPTCYRKFYIEKLCLGRTTFTPSFNPSHRGSACTWSPRIFLPVVFVALLHLGFMLDMPFLEFLHGSRVIEQTKLYAA